MYTIRDFIALEIEYSEAVDQGDFERVGQLAGELKELAFVIVQSMARRYEKEGETDGT